MRIVLLSFCAALAASAALADGNLQQRIDAGGEPSVPTPEIEPGMG